MNHIIRMAARVCQPCAARRTVGKVGYRTGMPIFGEGSETA